MDYFESDEFEYVKTMMATYFQTTGITCSLVDESGAIKHIEGQPADFCNKLKGIVGDESGCNESHALSLRQSYESGEVYASYCPSGLVNLTIALATGMSVGVAMVAGPLHIGNYDTYEVASLCNKHQLSDQKSNELCVSYRKVKTLTPDQVRFHMKLLTTIAKDIMNERAVAFERRKVIYEEQRCISENIQRLKEKEHYHLEEPKDYPIELEKELSTAILTGDEKQAKEILNRILGVIFYKYRADNRKITTIFIELLVIMSRAAVKGGARYDDVSKVTQEIIYKSVGKESIEEICHWLMDGLEKMILFVFPIHSNSVEALGLIRKAIVFMNEHLEEDITLNAVAEYVGLSPTYFSKLFSRDMKMSYIEYLTKIRIEQSKRYLVDTNESISDIAIRIGFNDQSYFSKVFKKVEDMTPGKFRKLYL